MKKLFYLACSLYLCNWFFYFHTPQNMQELSLNDLFLTPGLMFISASFIKKESLSPREKNIYLLINTVVFFITLCLYIKKICC